MPEDNLERVYNALLDSPTRDQALNYVTEDYSSTRIVYSVESDATQQEVTNDAQALANDFRFTATATGGTVVFQAISDTILASAIQSIIAALIATAAFLSIDLLDHRGQTLARDREPDPDRRRRSAARHDDGRP